MACEASARAHDAILSLFREWRALCLACDALVTDTDDNPMLKANLDRQVEIENEMAAIPAISVGSLAIKFFIINELGYLDSDLIPLSICGRGRCAHCIATHLTARLAATWPRFGGAFLCRRGAFGAGADVRRAASLPPAGTLLAARENGRVVNPLRPFSRQAA